MPFCNTISVPADSCGILSSRCPTELYIYMTGPYKYLGLSSANAIAYNPFEGLTAYGWTSQFTG